MVIHLSVLGVLIPLHTDDVVVLPRASRHVVTTELMLSVSGKVTLMMVPKRTLVKLMHVHTELLQRSIRVPGHLTKILSLVSQEKMHNYQ